jgi:hypothetical protein
VTSSASIEIIEKGTDDSFGIEAEFYSRFSAIVERHKW